MTRCPTCDSPAPHLHPAIQLEGEVEICLDPFHGPSAQTCFKAADLMRDAVRYLARQFRMTFSREEAMANMEARQIILNAEWKVIDDAEDLLERRLA